MDINASIGRVFGGYPSGTVHGLAEGNKSCTIYLSGSIDMQYAKDLKALLDSVLDGIDTGGSITMDMRYVDYISSTGVGAFVTSLVGAKKRMVSITLRDMQPKVRSVFDLLGFLSFFGEANTDA